MAFQNNEIERLFLNGIQINPESLNSFFLLKIMRAEFNILDSLTSLGLTANEAIDVLNEKNSNDESESFPWGDVYDIRLSQTIWWNDLVKDKRYRGWPSGVHQYLRPSYPGQLKYVRSNAFSCVFVLNLAIPSNLKYLFDIFMFIDRDVPLRLALIPMIDKMDSDGEIIQLFPLYLFSSLSV